MHTVETDRTERAPGLGRVARWVALVWAALVVVVGEVVVVLGIGLWAGSRRCACLSLAVRRLAGMDRW